MQGDKYTPSNGSEGDWFEDKFCMNCLNTNPDPTKRPQCDIWYRAVIWNINDELYPKEWVYDKNNKPTCTAWIKWDWGNDGDPNDPENPKAPQPEDPNQLVMPFLLDEINLTTKNIKKDDSKNLELQRLD